jgi:hypothetical protein
MGVGSLTKQHRRQQVASVIRSNFFFAEPAEAAALNIKPSWEKDG